MQVPSEITIVIDSHLKWLDVAAVPSANSTNTIRHLQNIFATHGLPQVLASDNGSFLLVWNSRNSG